MVKDSKYNVPTVNGVKKVLNNNAVIGTTAYIAPITQGNSASRLHMMTVQYQQRLEMRHPDLPYILSGGEHELAKYTFDDIMPCTAFIEAKIPFYSSLHQRDVPFTLIYRDDSTDIYDFIDVDNYIVNHTKFGYKKIFDDIVRNLSQGDILRKGQRLTRTRNIHEGDLHSNTLNTWTLYVSDPASTEDGFRVTPEFIERSSPLAIGECSSGYGSGSFPLYTYGNENNRRTMPMQGERIRDDGLIIAMREYSDQWDWIFCHEDLIDKPDGVFDVCLYGEPGAEVIDIEAMTANLDGRRHTTNPDLSSALEMHVNRSLAYSRRMLETYTSIMQDPKAKISIALMRKFAESFNVDPNSKDLISLLPKREQARLHAISSRQANRKPKVLERTRKNAELDEWSFSIRYAWRYHVDKGAKYAGQHGDKGVICEITPRDKMFSDEHGNVADMTVMPVAVIARMNIDQLIEQYINCFMWTIRKDCIALIEQSKWDEAWEHLITAYKICSPYITYLDVVNICQTSERKRQHLLAVTGEGKWPIITIHADSDHVGMGLIGNIIEYREPEETTIYFTDYRGVRIALKQKGIIAPRAVAILEKTAHNAMAASTARTQHHGIPTSSTQKGSMAGNIKEHAPKVFSETEMRMMSNIIGGVNVAMMAEIATNPDAAESSAFRLYASEKPMQLESLVDRDAIPIGGNNALNLINHELANLGVEFLGVTPDELDKSLNWRKQNGRKS